MSATDLLRRWFENEVFIGLQSVNGIIGTWSGPDAPGTAYVMMHHSVGDIGDGEIASWGYPEGGMGAVGDACARGRAVVRRRDPHERAGSSASLIRDGRAVGVVLDGGEELSAPLVVTAIHPKITFLEQIDRDRSCRTTFVEDIENWRTRSGHGQDQPGARRAPRVHGRPGLQPRHPRRRDPGAWTTSTTWRRRSRRRGSGRRPTLPFSDTAIPTVFDKTLAPEGVHVMSMFTQWVPAEWADEDGHEADLEAYADRLIDRMNAVAPELQGLDHAPADHRTARRCSRTGA